MKESFLQKAEILYNKGEYKEALDILFNVWKFEKSEKVGYLIVSSLRHQYHFKSALKWLERVDEQFPNGTMIENERIAVEYETKIKPVLLNGTLEEAVAEIEPILTKISDKEFIKKVIFSVVRKAKDESAWDIADQWLDKIQITSLTKKQREGKGKKRISERQRYYLSKYDVYTALNAYDKLADILLLAKEDFPELKVFQKQYQETLFKLERYDDILSIFNKEINWSFPNWGLVETASKAYFLKGELTEAWKLACMAFNSKGSQKVKVDLHLLISDIAEKLGKPEMAANFKTLSVLIRAEYKLEIPEELMEHIKTITDQSITSTSIIDMYEDDILDGIYAGKPRYEGRIVWFPLDKNFAKIKYSGSDKTIIIFKEELHEDCHYEGAKITFIEDKNIDSKSGEEREIARAGRRKVKLTPV